MSHIEEQLLEFIRRQVEPVIAFGSSLARFAAPDFLWQDDIIPDDLVEPLLQNRFPDAAMFRNGESLHAFYDIVDFLVACDISSEAGSRSSLMSLYVAVMSLAGICYHQLPESAEFGIAARCLVLVRAARSVDALEPHLAVSFVTHLHQHVKSNVDNYWEPLWVTASLAATSCVMSTRPAVTADLSSTLHEILHTEGWPLLLSETGVSDPEEAACMADLLSRCDGC